MQLDEQRLRFRDAMASLSAAVNIITTEGDAGQCGITATAVCSVTDTPPSLMVCINANSAMNPVFQGNGKLCVNVLNHEQELMARHFAGMTGMAMEERFSLFQREAFHLRLTGRRHEILVRTLDGTEKNRRQAGHTKIGFLSHSSNHLHQFLLFHLPVERILQPALPTGIGF